MIDRNNSIFLQVSLVGHEKNKTVCWSASVNEWDLYYLDAPHECILTKKVVFDVADM